MKIGCTALLCFYCLLNFSQIEQFELSTTGSYFRVGDHLEVQVTLIHDESQVLYFPDQNSDYGRFELVSKTVSPSRYTDDSLVVDQATYTLRTFELADSLPVFLDIKVGKLPDQTTKRTNIKWLHRKEGTLKTNPDQLVAAHRYQNLPYQVDYPLYLAVLVVLGIIVLGVLWLVVPKIHHQLKKITFKKKHQKFMTQYPSSHAWDTQQWQTYLRDWKADVSRSVEVSLVGYSNPKLKQLFGDSDAGAVFGKLDELLYNPKALLKLDASDFEALKALSQQKYRSKLQNLSQ